MEADGRRHSHPPGNGAPRISWPGWSSSTGSASLPRTKTTTPTCICRLDRNVAIELWTHAIGGLSENDFILAAKIDRLPIELKK